MARTMEHFVRSLLLLWTLVLPGTWAGSHSLRYIFTAMTRPGLVDPRFLSVGYVDDQQYLRFDTDSESQRVEPRAAWMEGVGRVELGYWEEQTRFHRRNAQVFRASLEILRGYFNQSASSVHTCQNMFCCEVTPELSFRSGFFQFAYDGQDYLALDTETYTWTPAVPQAVSTKREWEADRGYTKEMKAFVEECVKWLKESLETLKRADLPSARVTRHTAPHGEVTLRCRAQDFYPADISLTWLRDGQEQLQDTELIETRSSRDGTFQKWAAVGVNPGREGVYTCRVQHEGLPEPFTLQWDPPSSPTLLIVGAISAGLLLLISVIAGFVIWRRKNLGGNGRDYAPATGSDSAQGSGVSLTARA